MKLLGNLQMVNFNHKDLLGCDNCYWTGRLNEEDNTCPSCNEEVHDMTCQYNSTYHELEYLDKREIYYNWKKYREKRNEAK